MAGDGQDRRGGDPGRDDPGGDTSAQRMPMDCLFHAAPGRHDRDQERLPLVVPIVVVEGLPDVPAPRHLVETGREVDDEDVILGFSDVQQSVPPGPDHVGAGCHPAAGEQMLCRIVAGSMPGGTRAVMVRSPSGMSIRCGWPVRVAYSAALAILR